MFLFSIIFFQDSESYTLAFSNTSTKTFMWHIHFFQCTTVNHEIFVCCVCFIFPNFSTTK
jgi:hypothetical protein